MGKYMEQDAKMKMEKSKKALQELEFLKTGLEGTKTVQDYLKVLNRIEFAKRQHQNNLSDYHLAKMKDCQHILITDSKKNTSIKRAICIKCGYDTAFRATSSMNAFALAMANYHQLVKTEKKKVMLIYGVFNFQKIKREYDELKQQGLDEKSIVKQLKEHYEKGGES